jgi:hypothetical protein
VAIRIRPLSDVEKKCKSRVAIQCTGNSLAIVGTQHGGQSRHNAAQDKRYTFDNVYNQYATQAQIFDKSVKPYVDSVLSGFNATIFACTYYVLSLLLLLLLLLLLIMMQLCCL